MGGSFTLWLLNQWEKCLLTHWIGGWKGPRADLDVLEKRRSLISAGNWTPDCPRSKQYSV